MSEKEMEEVEAEVEPAVWQWWKLMRDGFMAKPVEVSWLVNRAGRGVEMDPDAARPRAVTVVDLVAYFQDTEEGVPACGTAVAASAEAVRVLDNLTIHGRHPKWALGICIQLEDYERETDDGCVTALWSDGPASAIEPQTTDDEEECRAIEGYDLVSLFDP
jgi:hypothetical protein